MSNGGQRGRESPRSQNQSIPGQHPPAHYPNYPPPPAQQSYPGPSPYQSSHPPPPGPPHHHQEMLHLPPPPQVPHDPYRGQHPGPPPHYDQAYGQGQPPPLGYPPQGQPQGSAVTFNQPAPRQRTAIACRYCRRRKIRCHGFDQNPEGRCSNCVRFNQECIFTPVSSQTHAFVPAHTAYPHLRNQGRMPANDGRPMYGGPTLYGAHGQPLGPVPPPAHSDAHYPPPPGPHQPYGAPAPYPTAPPSYDNRGPPHHAPPHEDQNRRTSSGYDHYPDPNHMTPISPASTSAGYQNGQYQGPYYAQPAPQGPHSAPAQQPTPTTQPRTSPTSNYSYDHRRGSASPHGSVNAGAGNGYAPYPGNLHPPQVLPPTNEGRNPSPAGQPRENGRANGMRINDMLDNSQSQGGRSNTDSNMLNKLNTRAP